MKKRSFDLEHFGQLRPYLFHLTARANLKRIVHTGRLESAATLAKLGGRPDLLDRRRRDHTDVVVNGDKVFLRDQAPLHERNMRLDRRWTFKAFVRHINARVFFWPGVEEGPIPSGLRYIARYEAEGPAILRMSFAALREANPSAEPLFCRYNSGSPRWSRGVPSPRGGDTFVRAASAPFGPAGVVEVTYLGEVLLPRDTECGSSPGGRWRLLR